MKRAVAAAVMAALWVGAPATGAGAAGPASIDVSTSIFPAWVYFADQVTARVDVIVDPSRVVPESIVVQPLFGPWEQVGTAKVSRAETGGVARRTEWFTLECLSSPCLPRGATVEPFHLPPVKVTARTTDGSTLEAEQNWPLLGVSGRFLPPESGNVRPALRRDTTLPAATFRASPSLLALLLDVLGGVALAIAVALALLRVGRRWAARRHPVDTRPPLARALALVRQAGSRDVDDRRRAAGLAARLMSGTSEVAIDAAETAWSREEPSARELEELAGKIETVIAEEP
jgi:hypothetical protein